VQTPADTGATRDISWLHQTAQTDGYQHVKTTISTQSYGNSGLTPQAVPALRCRAIVGPANNQLVDDSVADLLHAHGITWAPDPVVSADGIVASVAREISHLTEPEVQNMLAAIGDRLGALLDESARNGQPPLTVARQRLRRRLTQAQASAAPHPAVATARQPSPPQGDRLPPASTVLTAAHRGHNPQPDRRTNKARERALR
jgi:glutamate dehydrogenase/leucine dehydrogenase